MAFSFFSLSGGKHFQEVNFQCVKDYSWGLILIIKLFQSNVVHTDHFQGNHCMLQEI